PHCSISSIFSCVAYIGLLVIISFTLPLIVTVFSTFFSVYVCSKPLGVGAAATLMLLFTDATFIPSSLFPLFAVVVVLSPQSTSQSSSLLIGSTTCPSSPVFTFIFIGAPPSDFIFPS